MTGLSELRISERPGINEEIKELNASINMKTRSCGKN
jgi:hypothetical protein